MCAPQQGADVILSACSSIGGLVVAAQGEVAVPVVRIDGAMAEQAVEMGTVIAVADLRYHSPAHNRAP